MCKHKQQDMKTIFTDKDKADFVPEMGLKYMDFFNNTQWGMVGYYDTDINTPNTSVFDLHLITSLNGGECAPVQKEIQNDVNQFTSTSNVNVPAFETSYDIIIQKNIMNLNQTSCP